jgi:hypothetical protein
MYLDPTIDLISAELAKVKEKVNANVDMYRELLSSLSAADRKIYKASFDKSVNPDLGGDRDAYDTMLKICVALETEYKKAKHYVQVDQQPNTNLIPLVLMTREHIPAFKACITDIVELAATAVVGGLTTVQVEEVQEKARKKKGNLKKRQRATVRLDKNRDANVEADVQGVEEEVLAIRKETAEAEAEAADAEKHRPAKIIYRPNDETKSPYRIIEKSLTKGPDPDYPDCSKVFDVFGCIIECQDYRQMAAIVDAFRDRYRRESIQITRVKDRWTTPSDGGWRDLMINIVVNEIVYEVQVVLQAMKKARTALDAHKAYNQFRSFAEVFALLKLSTDVVVRSPSSEDTMDSEMMSHVVKLEADNVRLKELEDLLEFKDDLLQVTKQRLAVFEQRLAAFESEKKRSKLKIAQLEAQLAKRLDANPPVQGSSVPGGLCTTDGSDEHVGRRSVTYDVASATAVPPTVDYALAAAWGSSEEDDYANAEYGTAMQGGVHASIQFTASLNAEEGSANC